MTGGPWVMSAMIGQRTADDGLEMVEQLAIGEPVGQLVLVVHVVRGDWRGPIPVRVTGTSPADERVARLDLDLALPDAPEATGRIVAPLDFLRVQPGVYWFDVVAGETTLTRVPLPVR